MDPQPLWLAAHQVEVNYPSAVALAYHCQRLLDGNIENRHDMLLSIVNVLVGYGWFIAKAPTPGHRLIWHDGRVNGFRTYNGRYPDDGVTIIFLSNLSTLDELALARALERIVFAHLDRA